MDRILRLRGVSALGLLLAAAWMTQGDGSWVRGAETDPQHWIRVTSKDSLIHLGSLDSFDITSGGTLAAEAIYDHLHRNRPEAILSAMEAYERIIPAENFGGEYTALNWLCKYFVASPEGQRRMLANPLVADWYRLWSADNFAALKEYLDMKYHLVEYKNRKTPKSSPRFRFLEDFILFNNPDRERWERTTKTLEVLKLKEGDKVADIGCGPGYFTFKFSSLVGDTGTVYAIDSNHQHVEYVGQLARKCGVKNIKAMAPQLNRMEMSEKVDLAYVCSLYHNMYALSDVEERQKFVDSIKQMLKPDGRLVVIDNALVADKTLPYHGPYISKDLVINQMWHHGFQLVESYQFIPQRYILIFKSVAEPAPETTRVAVPADAVAVRSKASLVRGLKTTTFPGFSLEGRKLARAFLAALESGDRKALEAVRQGYIALAPTERIGDEYTAFEWFCDYALADQPTREKMLSQWLVREYFDRLGSDNFRLLKHYVRYKYFLDAIVDEEDHRRAGLKTPFEPRSLDDIPMPKEANWTTEQLVELCDYIAFNNPYREKWERTSKLLNFLKLKPGMKVADVGTGPGYYTFQFSELVGPTGQVSAVETVRAHLDRIEQWCGKYGIQNIKPVLTRDNNTNLPAESQDMIFLCSMYHAMYLFSMQYVQDEFIASVKQALKKDGRLVVVDNSILEGAGPAPYYGPGIDRQLVILQLKHYGFKLIDAAQFTPQRYVLMFQMN